MYDRRQFLRMWAGSSAILLPTRLQAGQGSSSGRVGFRLRETAGLRRFGYPVRVTLPARASVPGIKHRLLLAGKEIQAQFRPLSPKADRQEVALDFNASPGPFETEDYTIEFGPSLPSGPEPARGLAATQEKGAFRITNLPFLTYTIPDNLAGLVTSIKTPELEFLEPDSVGLFLQDRHGQARIPLALAPQGDVPVASWTRRGPIGVGLRFQGIAQGADETDWKTSIDLTFVNSKSWIEASWTVEDPQDRLGILGLELRMKLDGTTALVDCGASSTVYSHLRNGESLIFSGRPHASTGSEGPRWMIEQGTKAIRKPFAIASPRDHAPEGWIHLMDRARCSALALADFAVNTTDRFVVGGDGRMGFERRFAKRIGSGESKDRKTLRFWLHVVPTPVQVGAMTSPQSMLSPLKVEWME